MFSVSQSSNKKLEECPIRSRNNTIDTWLNRLELLHENTRSYSTFEKLNAIQRAITKDESPDKDVTDKAFDSFAWDKENMKN